MMSCISIPSIVEGDDDDDLRASNVETQSANTMLVCYSDDQYDECIPDYQGPLYVKSTTFGRWCKSHCRISGTKVFYSRNEVFNLTPAHHVLRFIEESSVGFYKLKDKYIVNIAEGSRIMLSLRADSEDIWESWCLHLNLALSLSMKLLPTYTLHTNVIDFDGYFHRTTVELMMQSFVICDLIQGREKFRELERFSEIEESQTSSGRKEQKLRKAFEHQSAKILVEILMALILKSPSEFSSAYTLITSWHAALSSNELSDSSIMTEFLHDIAYQRIRQHMLCNLKALGSIRDMCLELTETSEINEAGVRVASSPTSLSLSLKITGVLSFAAVYLYNMATMGRYPRPSYVGYNSQSPESSRDLHIFRNTDILSCAIACYNPSIQRLNSEYVQFFTQILYDRYPSTIQICEHIMCNIDKDNMMKRYFRGWGALVTASRSGDDQLFHYILSKFFLNNPPKQWINWKELLVSACGGNQSIPLIRIILEYFQSQRSIAATEILVLLVSSINTTVEVLEYFFHYYGCDPQCLDMSICAENGFVHPSSSYYASMRRFYRALPSFLDRQNLLHISAAGTKLDIVRTVYSWNHLQVKAVDIRGFLPIHIACFMSSSLEIIQYLCQIYPEGLLIESSSSSDVFWPDIRCRSSLPIHLATASCHSYQILRYLVSTYESIVFGNGLTVSSSQETSSASKITLLDFYHILKRSIHNVIVHSNQSFNSIRFDCLKYLIRKFRKISRLCHLSNLLLESDINIRSEDPIDNEQDLLDGHADIFLLSSQECHQYLFLPQYEYMPKRILNEQLVRIINPLLRQQSSLHMSTSGTFQLDQSSHRHYNWTARKAAMLIKTRYHSQGRMMDGPPHGHGTSGRLRYIQGQSSSRQSIIGFLGRLNPRISIQYVRREDNSLNVDRTSVGRASNPKILFKSKSCEKIVESTGITMKEKARYLWLNVLEHDDIFRLCVSFL